MQPKLRSCGAESEVQLHHGVRDGRAAEHRQFAVMSCLPPRRDRPCIACATVRVHEVLSGSSPIGRHRAQPSAQRLEATIGRCPAACGRPCARRGASGSGRIRAAASHELRSAPRRHPASWMLSARGRAGASRSLRFGGGSFVDRDQHPDGSRRAPAATPMLRADERLRRCDLARIVAMLIGARGRWCQRRACRSRASAQPSSNRRGSSWRRSIGNALDGHPTRSPPARRTTTCSPSRPIPGRNWPRRVAAGLQPARAAP